MLSYFADRLTSVPEVKALAVGHISRVVGLSLEAVGLNLALGTRCQVMASESLSFEVEVVVEPATTEQVVDSVVGVATSTEVTITEQVETTEDITVQVPVDIQVEQTTTATRTADGS